MAGDDHGPAEFRVNSPLSNLSASARAFGRGRGDVMVRPAAGMCRIW